MLLDCVVVLGVVNLDRGGLVSVNSRVTGLELWAKSKGQWA